MITDCGLEATIGSLIDVFEKRIRYISRMKQLFSLILLAFGVFLVIPSSSLAQSAPEEKRELHHFVQVYYPIHYFRDGSPLFPYNGEFSIFGFTHYGSNKGYSYSFMWKEQRHGIQVVREFFNYGRPRRPHDLMPGSVIVRRLSSFSASYLHLLGQNRQKSLKLYGTLGGVYVTGDEGYAIRYDFLQALVKGHYRKDWGPSLGLAGQWMITRNFFLAGSGSFAYFLHYLDPPPVGGFTFVPSREMFSLNLGIGYAFAHPRLPFLK